MLWYESLDFFMWVLGKVKLKLQGPLRCRLGSPRILPLVTLYTSNIYRHSQDAKGGKVDSFSLSLFDSIGGMLVE